VKTIGIDLTFAGSGLAADLGNTITIDVQTHYDGQATWDPVLAASSGNGMTPILFGSCGVGFVPIRRSIVRGSSDLIEAISTFPRPHWPRGANGIERASPYISTRSTGCCARSMSAHKSRTSHGGAM
jgi:hypothetical protein